MILWLSYHILPQNTWHSISMLGSPSPFALWRAPHTKPAQANKEKSLHGPAYLWYTQQKCLCPCMCCIWANKNNRNKIYIWIIITMLQYYYRAEHAPHTKPAQDNKEKSLPGPASLLHTTEVLQVFCVNVCVSYLWFLDNHH